MTSAAESRTLGAGAGRVALIGLGPMGAPIARHVAEHGYALEVWNRTAATAQEFQGIAKVAANPADLAADVVISALPDIDQLTDLTPSRVLEEWARNGTRYLVVLSTTSPEKVHSLSARMASYGIRVLDAPMSGGDAGARAGTLSLMVGADPEDFAALRPLFGTFASTVQNMGPTGAGSAAKLCNQIVVAGTLVALAESLDLARRAGLSQEKLVEVLRGGLAGSAVLELKAGKLLRRDYEPGGSAVNQLKDLRYALSLGNRLGAELPVTRETASLFETAVALGLGHKDHSVVQELFRSKRGEPE
ncbi:NAD(P)-dependent oxidoreductase [Sinomonas terrae]|uniref:NAD(P)-dependent oxidoreductase n=1 Tax=Sinomonas terrae TaxID=2908838 RepID=A0ABS9U0G4_9MICC|nr:NAD(P)-dependent oxidoreductase [Sinomonas terrae]MCH6470164.1 NAD(P)-dependent oxidoreductase [Sinomonas terrae]